MLSGTGYLTGKKTHAGAGMGKNLYPHAGIVFLTGRLIVDGYGYGMTIPDGFLTVAISRCHKSLCHLYYRTRIFW